jgi:hypothetical protein
VSQPSTTQNKRVRRRTYKRQQEEPRIVETRLDSITSSAAAFEKEKITVLELVFKPFPRSFLLHRSGGSEAGGHFRRL